MRAVPTLPLRNTNKAETSVWYPRNILYINFLKIYFTALFIFGCAGSSLLLKAFSSCSKRGLLFSWGEQASHCGGFSCCRAQALGCTGFGSCGAQTVAHRSSCPEAHGIFPDQGSNPCVFCIGWQVLNHSTTREVL